MAFMLPFIPAIAGALGALGGGEGKEAPPAPALPPKPGFGEMFARNEATFSQNNDQNQQLARLLGQPGDGLTPAVRRIGDPNMLGETPELMPGQPGFAQQQTDMFVTNGIFNKWRNEHGIPDDPVPPAFTLMKRGR